MAKGNSKLHSDNMFNNLDVSLSFYFYELIIKVIYLFIEYIQLKILMNSHML